MAKDEKERIRITICTRIYALKHRIDPKLIEAVIMTESSGNRFSYRYEPTWRYYPTDKKIKKYARKLIASPNSIKFGMATSWGLMHVIGTVAYENGFRGWFTELCSINLGIKYGCLILKKKIDRYGNDPAKIYAAYNAGSVRYEKDGTFINQKNVDNFMKHYLNLGGQS